MAVIQSRAGVSLPPALIRALKNIEEGAIADSQESGSLDFKQDPATSQKERNPDARIVELLLDECVCLANGDGGESHIILGVADKQGGPEAFLGTDRSGRWIESKIFNNTRPNLRVEVEEFDYLGARLAWIRIPTPLSVYTRSKGQATRRNGTHCEPLTTEARKSLEVQRANPDLTAISSEKSLEDFDVQAIERAQRLLAQKRHAAGDPSAPGTGISVMTELGLMNAGGNLSMAAEILFLSLGPGRISVRYLAREVPGGEPKVTELNGPLVAVIGQLASLIDAMASHELDRVQFENGQEVSIPTFPRTAVDEVISNALIHRDWSMQSAVVVDQSPITLRVHSPGPLPYGVHPDRLLTTQSIPRNPRLMAAMRMLGLAEESSRGFDRMWMSLLLSGREAPVVEATDAAVEVILSAGAPDHDFIRGVAGLGEEFGENITKSVDVLVVVKHLYGHPLITLKQFSEEAQRPVSEAKANMEWIESIGLVQRIRDADEWVFSDRARKAMGIMVPGEIAAVSIQEWVEEQLRSGEKLSAREVAENMGVERSEITSILTHLRTLGRAIIDPSGPQRGANARWVSP